MKLYFNILLVILLTLSFTSCKDEIKENEYLATEYGATGDGETLNTDVLQNLIDSLNQKGGGTIVFPKGRFLSGRLEMKSNVDLYLKKNAVLLGSTNIYDYATVVDKDHPKAGKTDDLSKMGFLISNKAKNFKLYGEGMIDGQGLGLALNVDSLHHTKEKIDPRYNYRRMRPNETARPKLFLFMHSENIVVEGLHLRNGACWGLCFDLCKNITMDNLKVVNRAYWNNDGMDITDCTNVRITNCDVDAADDGICLKSYYPGHFNDSIYIANCTVRSSASAIKFGTASFGGFKNVRIENIKVFDTFRSVVAIESVDGGIIENIDVRNVVAKNTGNAIFVRLGHRHGEKPGVIKNVSIKDMKVEIPFGRPDIDYDLRGPEVNFFHNPFPASITGIPGHNVENLKLENIEITYPGRASKGMAYVPLWRLNDIPEVIKEYPEFHMFGELPAYGMYVRHANNISFNNVTFILKDKDFRPAYVFDDVKELSMTNIKVVNSKDAQIIIKDSEAINLDGNAKALIKEIK
ncbi:glycoside hydrolase family 28 protein [Maribellus luteus]|uniref:Glycoside hydrolase family 28 protein n=1 Tax=Maribellus luteus TaxID=2305463 RepID=A0A399SV16_9BACT|nr:glycosyl hydrolase family 28 protein [Maribellus luteus]RIJ46462.1 glycoside hydrolase family 28 protein [Maribellus luteus]